MEISQPQFGAQPAIDAYGDGGFRIEGLRMTGSILLTPSGLHPWPVMQIDQISANALEQILAASASFEILLVGSGPSLKRPGPDVRSFFSAHKIRTDYMDTGAAARTYNVLLAEDRRVAAALIAV